MYVTEFDSINMLFNDENEKELYRKDIQNMTIETKEEWKAVAEEYELLVVLAVSDNEDDALSESYYLIESLKNMPKVKECLLKARNSIEQGIQKKLDEYKNDLKESSNPNKIKEAKEEILLLENEINHLKDFYRKTLNKIKEEK